MIVFRFDLTSFLLGVLSGVIGAFLLYRIWKAFPQLAAILRNQIQAYKNRSSVDLDYSIRLSALKKAQRNHLAASLFALEEIIIEPRFYTQPAFRDPALLPADKNISGKTIQFLLDYPDLASQYPSPTLSLSQLLSGNGNIFLISRPGFGKTVALAHLASQVARKEKSLGTLAEYIPLYLHVHELNLLKLNEDILQCFFQPIEPDIPRIRKSLMPAFTKITAQQGKIVLILDGLDEVDHVDFDLACQALRSLLQEYPQIRVVTTAPSNYWGALYNLGFAPIGIANWNLQERKQFLLKWLDSWQTRISTAFKHKSVYDLNNTLLSAWIKTSSSNLSPFEWTLRFWAICSNDLKDGRFGSLESFINRLGGSNLASIALENLATVVFKSPSGLIDRKLAEDFLNKKVVAEQEPIQNQPEVNLPPDKPGKPASKTTTGGEIVRILLNTGLLKQYSSGFIAFCHPLILGFLGKNIIEAEFFKQIDSASKISLRDEVILYFGGENPTAGNYFLKFLDNDQPPYHQNLLALNNYASTIPWTIGWKNEVTRYTTRVIHDPNTPVMIMGSLIGLYAQNDAGSISLLRQLTGSSSERARKFAILALGCIHDPKTTPDFVKCMNDPSQEVRTAACLALGIHQSPQSLQFAEKILSESDENARQAVAEALSFRGDDGVDTLFTATLSSNLLTRRAAVFGLAEIHKENARERLKKIAVEDGQWLVRNAATHAVESSDQPNLTIPQQRIAAADTPWLVEFAAKFQTGIIPGQPATDLLIKIMETGSLEEKLAALEFLSANYSDPRAMFEIDKAATTDLLPLSEFAQVLQWNILKSAVEYQS